MAIRIIVDVGNINEQRPTATSSDDKEDKKSLIAGRCIHQKKIQKEIAISLIIDEGIAKVTAKVTPSETFEIIESETMRSLAV